MERPKDIETRIRLLEEVVCELIARNPPGRNNEEVAPTQTRSVPMHTRSTPGMSPMVTRGPSEAPPKPKRSWEPVIHRKPLQPLGPQSWDATPIHQEKPPDYTYEPTFEQRPEIPQQWVATVRDDTYQNAPSTSWSPSYQPKPPPVPQTWGSSQLNIPSGQYAPTYIHTEFATPQQTRGSPCNATPCQTRSSAKKSPMHTRGPEAHSQSDQFMAAVYNPPAMELPDGFWDPKFDANKQLRSLEVEPDAIFSPPKHSDGAWDPNYDLIGKDLSPVYKPPDVHNEDGTFDPDFDKKPPKTSPGGPVFTPPIHPPGDFDPEKDPKYPPKGSPGGPVFTPPKHPQGDFDPEGDPKHPPKRSPGGPIFTPPIHPPGDFDPEKDPKHPPKRSPGGPVFTPPIHPPGDFDPEKDPKYPPKGSPGGPVFTPPKHPQGDFDPEGDPKHPPKIPPREPRDHPYHVPPKHPQGDFNPERYPKTEDDKRMENLEDIICKIAGAKYGTCYEPTNRDDCVKGLANFGDCFLQCLLGNPNRRHLELKDVLESIITCIYFGDQVKSINSRNTLECLKRCLSNCSSNHPKVDHDIERDPKHPPKEPPKRPPDHAPPKLPEGNLNSHKDRKGNKACQLIGIKYPCIPNTLPKCDPCQYASTPVPTPCQPPSDPCQYSSTSATAPCPQTSDPCQYASTSVSTPCPPSSDPCQYPSTSVTLPCQPTSDPCQYASTSSQCQVPSDSNQCATISSSCQPYSCVRTKNVETIVSMFDLMEDEAYVDIINKKNQMDSYIKGEASLS